MMMVETELRPSPIHGLGVFLLRPVCAGELVWRFDARIDRVYTPEEVASLPPHVQAWLATYCTWHEAVGLYVLCGDNGRYFNHSETPSTVSDAISFGEDRAARSVSSRRVARTERETRSRGPTPASARVRCGTSTLTITSAGMSVRSSASGSSPAPGTRRSCSASSM